MTKNRIAIFAHFDKDNIIDDYVVYFLKALKSVSDKIIFVSANDLSDFERKKVDNICEKIISEKHDEYDFGSYKRGFLYLLENNIKPDELIFANDSCYGPIFSFTEVFDKMNKEQCDFWGISQNCFNIKRKYVPHIQSYFFVLKRQILEDSNFISFIKNIKPEKSKRDVVEKYEVGLSQMLFRQNFIAKTYVNKYQQYGNSSIYAWRELLQKKLSPLVKCSLFRLQNITETTIEDWEKELDAYDYDINLIKNNQIRLEIRKINKRIPLDIKQKYFNFYRNILVRFGLKNYINWFIKQYFSFILD